MPTTDLEENKIKQAQPEEGNDTAQNEREIRKNIFKKKKQGRGVIYNENPITADRCPC